MQKRGEFRPNSSRGGLQQDRSRGGFRWKDPAWLLLVSFPLLVPLAYDPRVPQLKKSIGLLLITAALIIVLARTARAAGERPAFSSLSLPVLGVLGAAGLSLIVAPNRYEGILALYLQGLLSLGLLTWMASTVRSRDQVLALTAAACLAASIAAGVGIVQYLMPGSFAAWGAGGAVIGTTGNPNYLGAYLAVAAPIAAGLALGAPTTRYRALGLGSLAPITLGLLVTRTRAAWLGYLAGLGTIALLLVATRMRRGSEASRRHPDARRALILGGCVLIALLIGAAGMAWRGDRVVARFTSILDRTDPSIHARLQWWRDALQMIRDHPILGTGVGNSPLVFIRYNRVPEYSAGYRFYLEHLHNEPLAFAAELGVPGIIAGLVLLIWLARLGWRAAADGGGAGDPLGMGVFGSLVAAAMDSLFFYNLHELTVATTIWMMVGLLEALGGLRRGPRGLRGLPTSSPKSGRPRDEAGVAILRWACRGMLVALLPAWWVFAARPGMADYYTARGVVELNAGQTPAAVRSLETALAWDSRHPSTHFLLGQALEVAGRNQEAIQQYQESLRHNPNDFAALYSIGFLYQMAGQIVEARDMYQRAMTINPYVATIHSNLATVLLAEGKPAEAIAHLRRALDLFPRHAPAANALAMAYIQLDRFEEAETALRQAVEFDPSFAMAWLNLYKLRGLLENWRGAAEALSQAIHLSPALEAEARRADFFDRVWAAGTSMQILPVRPR